MLGNLFLGLTTMVICLLLQTWLVVAAMRYYIRHEHDIKSPAFFSSLAVLSSVMLILVFGNLIQVAIWGLLFVWLGEFATFAEAFYHSMVNFATLGYGDFVMSEQHKLLGPLESVNGVLMIGVSSAMLLTALQDAMKKSIEARRQ
ncbi:MAG: ion channel [Halopseudomonas sp.]